MPENVMDRAQKIGLIDEFERMSHAFDDLPGLDGEIVDYRPLPDAWSIREQVIHCLDVDVANFHRYRWGITRPGTRVLSFDQTWTGELHYGASDPDLAVAIIKSVRRFMAGHLRTLLDEDWAGWYYILGENTRLNLEEALRSSIDHVHFHRRLIDRNIGLYGGTTVE
jgi:hypothetical protein